MSYTRKPIVAGVFYEQNEISLRKQIIDCFQHPAGPFDVPSPVDSIKAERTIKCVISPHAGYMFSGPIAAHHYLQLSQQRTPDTIIIIGTAHQGPLSENISIMTDGQWETPLGSVEIDEVIAKEIIKNDSNHLIQNNINAHLLEHSIEVQIPFLQYIYPENSFKIVPIRVNNNEDLIIAKNFTEILFKAISIKSCLIIASTDFNHYENHIKTQKKDLIAIDHILNMDSDSLYHTIEEKNITICGAGAIATVIEYSKKIGINQGNLLKYATSGDISGHYNQVVGYASIVFSLKNSLKNVENI